VLESATRDIPETECGGHPLAAGCLIKKDYETNFLNQVSKTLDLEVVKI
jgi:hypothetical protein